MKSTTRIRRSRKVKKEYRTGSLRSNIELAATLRVAHAEYGEEAANIIEMLVSMMANDIDNTLIDIEIAATHEAKMKIINNASKAFHGKGFRPLETVVSMGRRLHCLGGIELMRYAVSAMCLKAYVNELDYAFAGIEGYRHKRVRNKK